MVDGFDARHAHGKIGLVRRQMFRQLVLGAGRPDDQDRARPGESLGDVIEEILVDRRMAAADRVGLGVQMHHPVVGMDHGTVDLVGIEVKDLRFVMIDPDDGVKMRLHTDPCLRP